MIPLETLSRWLRCATLLFLTVPLGLFFAGWLRWPLAAAECAALAAAVWRDRAGTDPAGVQPAAETAGVSWRGLFLMLVLPAAVLTLLSGAGGWGAGDSDWLKHDTILRDLLVRPWPVTYESGHGPVLLVYYVTYYLPAALLGKLTGGSWTVASQTLALTTFLGVVLAGGWMVALARRGGRAAGRGLPATGMALVAAAVFFGFSGLDVLGKMAVNLFFHLPVFYGDWSDIEWWAQFAQYSSNAATVFWAPQHAFGGWLTTALALDDWDRGRGPEGRGVFYVALALAWSPFAAVGLLPLVGGMILWRRAHAAGEWRGYAHLHPWDLFFRRLALTRGWWRRLLTMENGAGLLAGGMFALFLAAHFQAYPLPARYKVTPEFPHLPLLTAVPRPVLYAVFVCIEFLGFSVALAWFSDRRSLPWPRDWKELPPHERRKLLRPISDAYKRTFPERALLWLATAILLVLPWFRYGYANDLVMRGGIPALFVLQVLLVRMFAQADGQSTRRQRLALGLAAVLFIGGLGNTFLEYRRHVVRVAAQGSWRDPRTREPVRTLAELHRTIYARPGFDFARQYLGSADSPFARYAAARRGALRPDAPTGGKPDF